MNDKSLLGHQIITAVAAIALAGGGCASLAPGDGTDAGSEDEGAPATVSRTLGWSGGALCAVLYTGSYYRYTQNSIDAGQTVPSSSTETYHSAAVKPGCTLTVIADRNNSGATLTRYAHSTSVDVARRQNISCTCTDSSPVAANLRVYYGLRFNDIPLWTTDRYFQVAADGSRNLAAKITFNEPNIFVLVDDKVNHSNSGTTINTTVSSGYARALQYPDSADSCPL